MIISVFPDMGRVRKASLLPLTSGQDLGEWGAQLYLLQENEGWGWRASKHFGSTAWTSGHTQTRAFEHSYA